MKKIIFLIGFLTVSLLASAQQELLLSQQFYSRINKNPAGTGNVEDIDLFLLGHYQYAGVEDAPKSLLFNGHTFIRKINSGVGLSLSYDNLGIARSFLDIKAVYSYMLRPADNMLVSLGLGFGVRRSAFDKDAYSVDNIIEMYDGTIPDEDSKVRPDFDFGVEFAMNDNLLFGASVTHLLDSASTTMMQGRHLNLYGRYMFKLNDKWDIAPSLTYMHHAKTNVLELNVTGYYERFIWGGLTYHPDLSDKFGSNPLAITLGVEYFRFRLGYTIDLGLGKISHMAGTSHELMLSYSVDRKRTKSKDMNEEIFE